MASKYFPNLEIDEVLIKSPISPLFARGGTQVQHLLLQSGNLNDFLSALGLYIECNINEKFAYRLTIVK